MTSIEFVRIVLTSTNIRSLFKLNLDLKEEKSEKYCVSNLHYTAFRHRWTPSLRVGHMSAAKSTYNKNDAENTSSHGDCGFCHQPIIIM